MSEILREHYQLKETIVTIMARELAQIEAAKRAIIEQRVYLEDFIGRDPFFKITLEPYDLREDGAPAIIRQMTERSALFGIGPMASVAGAIAGYAVAAMMEEGATHAVVDNGGDICILNDHPLTVGIYAGGSPIRDLAFEISPRKAPLGICTSSGTIGPSISFGWADSAVVVSGDVMLADAAATALGNAVNAEGSLQQCFSAIDRPGIDGALIVRGREMAMWGDLPPLRRARLVEDRITRE
ncbi:MAG TPA: UPF0280 family protein [Methanothrix sp.]|nr:UPF0280 family protein [Methanothrix sp.]HQJ79890.1 UPF0280 family protein [Methanothrix sp.]